MLDKKFELKSEKHSFPNQISNDSKYLNYKPYSDLEWSCIRRLLNTYQANGFIEKDNSLTILKDNKAVMWIHREELSKLEVAEQELQFEFDKLLWGEDLEFLPKSETVVSSTGRKFSKEQIDKAINNIQKGFNPNSNKSGIKRSTKIELVKNRFNQYVTSSSIELFLRHCKEEGHLDKDSVYQFNTDTIKYNDNLISKIDKMTSDKVVVYEIIGVNTEFSVKLLFELLQDSKDILNTIDFGRPRLLVYGQYFEVGTEFRLKDGEIMTRDRTNFGYRFKNGEVVGTINWIDLD